MPGAVPSRIARALKLLQSNRLTGLFRKRGSEADYFRLRGACRTKSVRRRALFHASSRRHRLPYRRTESQHHPADQTGFLMFYSACDGEGHGRAARDHGIIRAGALQESLLGGRHA